MIVGGHRHETRPLNPGNCGPLCFGDVRALRMPRHWLGKDFERDCSGKEAGLGSGDLSVDTTTGLVLQYWYLCLPPPTPFAAFQIKYIYTREGPAGKKVDTKIFSFSLRWFT